MGSKRIIEHFSWIGKTFHMVQNLKHFKGYKDSSPVT